MSWIYCVYMKNLEDFHNICRELMPWKKALLEKQIVASDSGYFPLLVQPTFCYSIKPTECVVTSSDSGPNYSSSHSGALFFLSDPLLI
jgi:hypothetical protein